jgi:flagellar basal body-associated protein FliL
MPVILLIGPAVAVVGLVAVFFVMRHKSVEKRSMYSARRSQIEHKVRAARQRTLVGGKHEKAGREEEAAPAAAPTLTYEPSAYAGPPVAPPPQKGRSAPAWDTGPTAPSAPAPPPPPTFTPAPAYEPPPYEAPTSQPAWTPTPLTPEQAEPEQAAPAPAQPATTSAGAGASWSIVGETKASAEAEPAHKKKRSKEEALTQAAGSWSLASGEAAGEETEEGPKKASALLPIAQYAVLVVGLVMVLIGVVVMVANSHAA